MIEEVEIGLVVGIPIDLVSVGGGLVPSEHVLGHDVANERLVAIATNRYRETLDEILVLQF
jgi:hypothetical protein